MRSPISCSPPRNHHCSPESERLIPQFDEICGIILFREIVLVKIESACDYIIKQYSQFLELL